MSHGIPGRPLRALGLLRVSTKRQAEEGYSLADQERMIRECAAREGWELVEVVPDGGKSGRIQDRPAVRRMLELADEKAIDLLVFVKVDRAGRKLRVILDILREAERRGVPAYFVEGGRTDTKHGRFLVNVLGSVAELNWEDIRQQLRDGKRDKAAEGRFPSRIRIYGLHCVLKWEEMADPSRKSGTFEINETEAAVVRQAFRWYRETGSLRETARRLSESGHPSPHGSRYWHLLTTRNLLTRSCYVTGEVIYGRREYYESQATRDRPESEWQKVPCPVLVDRETWDAVQALLDQAARSVVRGRPSSRWLLRGVIFCGVCVGLRGEPLRCSGINASSPAADRKRWSRYQCNSIGHAQLRNCGAQVNQKKLEALVVARVQASLEPGEWGKVARREKEEERAAAAGGKGKARELEAELGRVESRARNLVELAARGAALDLVTAELQALDRRRQDLKREIAGLQAQEPAGATPAQAERRAEARSRELRERWEEIEGDPELLQAVLRQTVRVTLWPGGRDPDIVVTVREVVLPR